LLKFARRTAARKKRPPGGGAGERNKEWARTSACSRNPASWVDVAELQVLGQSLYAVAEEVNPIFIAEQHCLFVLLARMQAFRVI